MSLNNDIHHMGFSYQHASTPYYDYDSNHII